MTMLSYSQNFEDVMLSRAFKDIENGFYIDVGAHSPVAGSVTKAFYDKNWHGINIEPIQEPYRMLENARLRDINLQICLGNMDGEIDIYDVHPSGLATVDPEIAQNYIDAGNDVRKISVQVRKLSGVCQEFVTGDIHFLKVDVEGAEKKVLEGMNFAKYRPWIVVVEATIPNSSLQTHDEWEYILTNSDYIPAYFDGLNRFYVSREHEELVESFVLPPNYFDDFFLSEQASFSQYLHQKIRVLEEKSAHLEEHLTLIKNSKSWRWTASFRYLLRKVKAFFIFFKSL